MAIVNDAHLAYLLSLGFDIDLCKQALSQNSTLENATEWYNFVKRILNPTQPPNYNNQIIPPPPESDSSISTSFLVDPPPQPTCQANFSFASNTAKKEDQEQVKFQKKQFEKLALDMKKDKQLDREAKQRALQEIKEDQEKRRILKHHSASEAVVGTSTEQQQLSERDRVQLQYRKEKRAEQEQRQRILQNIRQDQKDKQKMRRLSSTDDTSSSSSTPRTTTTTKTKSMRDIDQQDAFIQFKLTNVSILRQKFPASTLIKELLEFVLSKEIVINNQANIDNVSLICPFPRRTFTVKDQALNIKEAGFLPNVSLNVAVTLLCQPPPTEEEPPQEEEHDEQEETGNSANSEEDYRHSQTDSDNTETDDDEHDDDDMDIDDNDHHLFMPPPPPRGDHHHRGPIWNDPNAQGHHLTDPSTAPPVNVVEEEEENEGQAEANRRRNMLSAIEQRSSSNTGITAAVTVNKPFRKMERNARTLKDITMTSVALFLNQHTTDTTRYLKKMNYVSSELAESLIVYLIKNGKLNVSTLKKLADHCYLQNVVLDSYTYCTDSLIEALGLSNSCISLTRLSLRGCDVITDVAIRSLEKLKNLNYLDLNNCKVTDKGLKSLEKLHHLVHLNLSKTKINTGLDSLIKNAMFKSELQVLLLDGCTRLVSNRILIPIINEFTNLLQLSYAYTSPEKVPGKIVSRQDQPQQVITNKQVQLEMLDVSHTFISDQTLMATISQFKSLVELKLAGCKGLTTRSLSFLPRELKNLRMIQFPNREHELDGVLLRYKDLPIEHLDLTGYLNVTDEGAQHIAAMKHLRYLSLDGTKVTDEGVTLFSNLIELEKLYLDRTLLTDAGLSRLTGLSKLETLSLSRTEVSNTSLCLLGDFEQTSFTRNLRTLNLAQCHLVSDKGVRALGGMMNLTNLNLDHTGVSKFCLKYLKDLENLNLVRLQGIEKKADDTIDSD